MTLGTALAAVGDKLVVPACSVGEVMAIETLEVAGDDRPFYRIRFPEGARTWVPLGTLAEKGIRPVMSREDAQQVLEIARAVEAPEKRVTWNRRHRRYTEMQQENTPRALAELIGELAAVRRDKGTLSFTEKKLYRQVAAALATELAHALDVDVEAATKRLEAALA